MSVSMRVATQDEIEKAIYGRRRGGRYRVCPPEERTADGIVFDSGHEMDVYLKFKSLVNAGTFTSLLLQVAYPIHVTNERGEKIEVFKWVADFVVIDRDGRTSVYDAKGHRTAMYKLKKKAVEAQYSIRILET